MRPCLFEIRGCLWRRVSDYWYTEAHVRKHFLFDLCSVSYGIVRRTARLRGRSCVPVFMHTRILKHDPHTKDGGCVSAYGGHVTHTHTRAVPVCSV